MHDDTKPITLVDLRNLFAEERKATNDQLNELTGHMLNGFTKVDEQLNKIASAVVTIQAELLANLATKASADDMHKVIDALADIGGQYKDHQEDHALDSNRITRVERRLDEIAQLMGYEFKTQ
jgi:uncharacterized phage infection (PIP) family protein YhgE